MALIKFTNFAYSLLASSITNVETTISVTSGHGLRFPVLGVDEYFFLTLENAALDREIVKVTARATDSLTVVRAQDNTTARAWTAGAAVSLRINAEVIETLLNTTDALTAALTTKSGATGGGDDEVFVQNDQAVTTSYTIPGGKNASTVGPITVPDGIIITVSSGSRWVVL